MPAISYYVNDAGICPFERFFNALSDSAALKVTTFLRRLQAGNTSALKPVGGGVHELRIDFGPGYRVYLGNDGQEIVVLLGGGTKTRQGSGIRAAQAAWTDFRSRKEISIK